MEKIIIEKIAAGLRKVGKTAEVILYDIECVKGVSEEEVCGIPLVGVNFGGWVQSDDKDCPFIPVYKGVEAKDIYWFRRGYEER